MTQRYLAEELDVSHAAVSTWESGARIPTRGNAQRWADLLGVELPSYSDAWFNRDEVSKVQRHGTRQGYQWHQRHNDMPPCRPCLDAQAQWTAVYRAEKAANT